ncbi:MAG: hypothetical protein ACRDE7_05695 [Sphingobacterium sp.]
MRKLTLIYCFLITLIVSSCVSNNKENNSEDIDSTNQNLQEQTLTNIEKLEDYILALDSTDINSVGKATLKFKELFQKEDTLINDRGVSLLLKYMDVVSLNANESTFEEDVNYAPLIDIEINNGKSEVPDELEADYKKITDNGFRVRQTEGMYSLILNPFFIQEQFYPYVSATFEIFLQQLGRENIEGYASDAAIIIPYQTFVQRTIWWETFAKNTAGTPAGDQAKNVYTKYFRDLTIGMDNTPTIESQQISPYFHETYQYLKEFAPHSETYEKLENYINLLEQQEIEQAKSLLPDLIGNQLY